MKSSILNQMFESFQEDQQKNDHCNEFLSYKNPIKCSKVSSTSNLLLIRPDQKIFRK